MTQSVAAIARSRRQARATSTASPSRGTSGARTQSRTLHAMPFELFDAVIFLATCRCVGARAHQISPYSRYASAAPMRASNSSIWAFKWAEMQLRAWVDSIWVLSIRFGLHVWQPCGSFPFVVRRTSAVLRPRKLLRRPRTSTNSIVRGWGWEYLLLPWWGISKNVLRIAPFNSNANEVKIPIADLPLSHVSNEIFSSGISTSQAKRPRDALYVQFKWMQAFII